MDGPFPLRLFIALALPEEYQQAMANLCQEIRSRFGPKLPRIRWTRPGNWHLTLKFLGDVDEEALPRLSMALGKVLLPPFSLQAGGAGFFPPAKAGREPNPRVLWTGLEKGGKEAFALAMQMEEALHPLGFPREKRSFSPHLTLGRIKQGRGKVPHGVPWTKVLEIVEERKWPEIGMACFVLYRSVLGPEGPKYSVVEKFGCPAGGDSPLPT